MMIERLQPISIWLVVIAGLTISILDLSGLLAEVPWLVQRIPTITLLILAMIASYLGLERRKRLDELQENNQEILRLLSHLPENTVMKFRNSHEAINHLCQKAKEARESIEQASIDKRRGTFQPAHAQFHEIKSSIIEASEIDYRYLFGVNERRIHNVSAWLDSSQGKFVAAGIAIPKESLGLLSFTIFDRQEVYVRSPYPLGQTAEYLSIRQPDIVNLFLEWFNFLWGVAKQLDPDLLQNDQHEAPDSGESDKDR